MSKSLQLAQAIARLESSPLQRDYVPPEIQALAREVIAESATDACELRAAALDLLDWIERTEGTLFREEHVTKRGRIDVDEGSANQEHNNQVRDAIERLRIACGPEQPQPQRCDVWRTSERGDLCTREKGHVGPHHCGGVSWS